MSARAVSGAWFARVRNQATAEDNEVWTQGVRPQPVDPAAKSTVGTWLIGFAFAVIVGMQAGTVFAPFGSIGATRVADWIDLLTPFVVLGCAAIVLHRADADRMQWTLFGAGAVMFALGKGLHISANSVSNVDDPVVADASIVHLWDEIASHYIWYTGLFIVLVALFLALRHQQFRVGAVGALAAALFAVTLVNTYIEGGVPWLGMAFLITGVAAGRMYGPSPVARLVVLVGGFGLLLLVGWGAYWYLVDGSVFPQFSELGWI